jgi:hypothetical protein
MARSGVDVAVTVAVGCAVSEGGWDGTTVIVDSVVGSLSIATIGLDIWQASKNKRASMEKAG